MRTATGLTVMAVGAILAFAVSSQPSFLNLHVTGWVLMLTGVAGMAIPARGYGWLRRRLVWRRGPGGPVVDKVEESEYPSYIMLGSSVNASRRPGPGDEPAAPDGPHAE